MSVRFIAYLALLAATIALIGCEPQAPPSAPSPLTVWIDYADGTPTPAHDDGCSGSPLTPVAFDAPARAAFEAGLSTAFGGLAVTFTTSHPEREYVSVVVTGGTWQECPGAPPCTGEAPILCPDHPRSASGYVFTNNDPGETPGNWALVAAHEVGHMLGLVHVTGDDIMNPNGQGPVFGIAPLLGDEPSCDGSKIQDAPSILLARLGPVWTSVTP
jgi:hypothetical protein